MLKLAVDDTRGIDLFIIFVFQVKSWPTNIKCLRLENIELAGHLLKNEEWLRGLSHTNLLKGDP